MRRVPEEWSSRVRDHADRTRLTGRLALCLRRERAACLSGRGLRLDSPASFPARDRIANREGNARGWSTPGWRRRRPAGGHFTCRLGRVPRVRVAGPSGSVKRRCQAMRRHDHAFVVTEPWTGGGFHTAPGRRLKSDVRSTLNLTRTKRENRRINPMSSCAESMPFFTASHYNRVSGRVFSRCARLTTL